MNCFLLSVVCAPLFNATFVSVPLMTTLDFMSTLCLARTCHHCLVEELTIVILALSSPSSEQQGALLPSGWQRQCQQLRKVAVAPSSAARFSVDLGLTPPQPPCRWCLQILVIPQSTHQSITICPGSLLVGASLRLM